MRTASRMPSAIQRSQAGKRDPMTSIAGAREQPLHISDRPVVKKKRSIDPLQIMVEASRERWPGQNRRSGMPALPVRSRPAYEPGHRQIEPELEFAEHP